MTTAATRKPITAEEFAQLPEPKDGSKQELVRGVIVTMPPPGGVHGHCGANVAFSLMSFVKANRLGRIFINDTGFILERDPDTVRGPDVAFWTHERLPEVPKGYIQVAPDLAVEIVSPSDHFTRVQNKVREYLSRGVRLIWVVDPEDRSISVYRSLEHVSILTENSVLSGEDVLPGYSCRVAEFFNGP